MHLALRASLVVCCSSIALACSTGSSRDDSLTSFSTGSPTDDSETGSDGECGNGTIEGSEQCDLGPDNAADGDCTPACTLAACGDGYHNPDLEQCDDGNSDNSDACVADCALASCGDGFVQTDVEQCDDGNDDETDACNSMCLPASCGDGVVQAGEQCDDGNRDTTDDCPACQLAFCGDGYTQTDAEACDDGNDDDTDACVVNCTNATCGDGLVWAGAEQCDDANADDGDACPGTCQNASCGDGFVWTAMEQCDDGNPLDGDGCDAACSLECDDEIVIENWNGWTYYKVPVAGTLSDANVAAACLDCGLAVPCTGLDGCLYNANECAQTSNEPGCGQPMNGLSQHLCGSGVAPSACAALWGIYQHMGNSWQGGSACGAEQDSWCANGIATSDKFALCVAQQ